MADYTTAARPYARAVYSRATETSTVAEWGDALALMAAVAADPGMQELLEQPQLSKEQKGELNFDEIIPEIKKIDLKTGWWTIDHCC